MRRRMAAFLLAAVMSVSATGCDWTEIQTTTTTTLDSREVIITLVRSAIITPLDQALTAGIGKLLGLDEEDD